MDKDSWLNDIQIDLALESMREEYPHVTILTNADQAHAHIRNNGFIHDFENTPNLIMVLRYQEHWVTATNIDTGRNLQPISDVNVPIFVYDSLNNPTYLNSLQLTLSTMFPNKGIFYVHHATMHHKQVSVNDCGLFALAYVRALCLNLEPSLVHFCQETMRHEYNESYNLITYKIIFVQLNIRTKSY